MKKISFLSCCLFAQLQLWAENNTLNDQLQQIAQKYSIALDSVARRNAQQTIDENLLLDNPYYFPIFGGKSLYAFPLKQNIGTIAADQKVPTELKPTLDFIHKVLLHSYVQQPQAIELLVWDKLKKEAQPTQSPTTSVSLLPTASVTTSEAKKELPQTEAVPLLVKKPNFWNFAANFSLQFMQYHVSANWYKGGEDHNSLIGTLNLEANYDNKEKLTLNNKLEMRLGYQSSNSDTKHKYKTNTDQIRLTNKVGLQASKHWYYTAMLQTWTQFSPGYQSNDEKVYSDFLSPLESILSFGMDFKQRGKIFEANATLSPFAAKLKYVDRSALTTRFGLKANEHHDLNLGSTITINMRWKIHENVQWSSRLFYFSNFESVQAEWENTLSLKVNKYLSTKLFLYPRFDDKVKRKSNNSYLQFNEYLSVGLDWAL